VYRKRRKEFVFAGKLMRIAVLDHIIIGDSKYFSFADDGLIEKYIHNYSNMKKGNIDV